MLRLINNNWFVGALLFWPTRQLIKLYAKMAIPNSVQDLIRIDMCWSLAKCVDYGYHKQDPDYFMKMLDIYGCLNKN